MTTHHLLGDLDAAALCELWQDLDGLTRSRARATGGVERLAQWQHLMAALGDAAGVALSPRSYLTCSECGATLDE